MWKAIYAIDVIADFATYEPADEDAVEAVNHGSGAPPDFKLDFGKGWTSSRWNKLILQKIYKDLLESRQSHGGWNLPDVSEDYVMSMLRGQLKRSREAWAEMQPRFSFETADFEGEEDTVKRVENAYADRQEKSAARARRQRVSHFLNVIMIGTYI